MMHIHKIIHEGKVIEFEVIRSNRLKTSEIIVEPNKVLVRVPNQKSFEEVEKIVKRKAAWIVRKQEEYKAQKLQIVNPSFEHESMLPYLGKSYQLHIFTGHKEEKIRLVRGELLVTLTSKRVDKKQVKALYENWLMDRGETLFLIKVKHYATKIGVSPKRLMIKKLRKRWGSATKEGVLNLNVNLLKAPEEVIDYVIVHELCHLKVQDHSHRFWRLLKSIMPSYKQKEDWLTANSLGLIE